MPKVISEDPKIVLNKFAKEFMYGFAAYLIVYLFDLFITTLSPEESFILLLLCEALEHALLKALDEYNIEYSAEFVPFYQKIIKIIQTKFFSEEKSVKKIEL